MPYQLGIDYQPRGDQPAAIEQMTRGILDSEKQLWKVIKDEFKAMEDEYAKNTDTWCLPKRHRTRIASEDALLEFDAEKYIVKENTNVVLTRDGWIKRVGRLASVEGTRVREGDSVIAVVPASTLDHVVFFADDGTAYTMRVNEVPASSGYGEPLAKFFKLADQVRIIGESSRVMESGNADRGNLRTGVVGQAAGGRHDCQPDGSTDRFCTEPRLSGAHGMGLRRRRL